MIVLISPRGNAVRLDFDSFTGMIFPQEFSFGGIARQHRVRVMNEPARLQQQSKDFPPFKAAVGRPIEHGFQCRRKIQQSAVNRNNKRQSPTASHRGRNAAQPAKRVRVDERHVRFTPHCRKQIEGHQVATQ